MEYSIGSFWEAALGTEELGLGLFEAAAAASG